MFVAFGFRDRNLGTQEMRPVISPVESRGIRDNIYSIIYSPSSFNHQIRGLETHWSNTGTSDFLFAFFLQNTKLGLGSHFVGPVASFNTIKTAAHKRKVELRLSHLQRAKKNVVYQWHNIFENGLVSNWIGTSALCLVDWLIIIVVGSWTVFIASSLHVQISTYLTTFIKASAPHSLNLFQSLISITIVFSYKWRSSLVRWYSRNPWRQLRHALSSHWKEVHIGTSQSTILTLQPISSLNSKLPEINSQNLPSKCLTPIRISCSARSLMLRARYAGYSQRHLTYSWLERLHSSPAAEVESVSWPPKLSP